MRRQVTWNPAGRAGTILIEREELYASVDRVAQEDRETVADFSLPISFSAHSRFSGS